jgi:Uma2 family endonuclease
MVHTHLPLTTFEDFLQFSEATDAYYELTNGELIEMPPEPYENIRRALKLYDLLRRMVDVQQICPHGLALAVPGQPKNRYPDLTVLRPEHPEQMQALGQAAITLDMALPLLVVEVVSPGPENHRRDYFEKRNQYEWRGIPEYWILEHPGLAQVTVLSLTATGYDAAVFAGEELVRSSTFTDFTVSVTDLLVVN